MQVATTTLVLVALLVPTAAAAPQQVHLGITEDPATSLLIQWLEDAPPRDDASVDVATPNGTRSVAASVVSGPSLGTVYEARVDGLAPGTEHAYSIDGAPFSLRTPPANLSGGLRVVALGDMGTSERARATASAVAALDPDLVLHAGDISYGEGNPVTWASWFNMVESVASRVPWVTALGNHETYTGAGVNGIFGIPSPAEIAFYKQRFGLPGNELWYSFDVAGVHFVALDTFSEAEIAPAQMAWLAMDLAANANASWTIVLLHEPPYSSNANHGSSVRVQNAFVRLFEEHGVDLVIAAHDHSYERTVQMGGVTYLVTGGGGQSLYSTWEPQPEWSAVRAAEYHVTSLTIHSDRVEIDVRATGSGEWLDRFVLNSTRPLGEPATIGRGTPALSIGILVVLVVGSAFGLRRRD